jgi:hypothetical protein
MGNGDGKREMRPPAGAAHLQGHPALLLGDPEPLLVQVGMEELPGVVHGMGDLIALLALLSGDIANAAHNNPVFFLEWRRGKIIIIPPFFKIQGVSSP